MTGWEWVQTLHAGGWVTKVQLCPADGASHQDPHFEEEREVFLKPSVLRTKADTVLSSSADFWCLCHLVTNPKGKQNKEFGFPQYMIKGTLYTSLKTEINLSVLFSLLIIV